MCCCMEEVSFDFREETIRLEDGILAVLLRFECPSNALPEEFCREARKFLDGMDSIMGFSVILKNTGSPETFPSWCLDLLGEILSERTDQWIAVAILPNQYRKVREGRGKALGTLLS